MTSKEPWSLLWGAGEPLYIDAKGVVYRALRGRETRWDARVTTPMGPLELRRVPQDGAGLIQLPSNEHETERTA